VLVVDVNMLLVCGCVLLGGGGHDWRIHIFDTQSDQAAVHYRCAAGISGIISWNLCMPHPG
jgi:hypothetical protein